MTPSMPSSTSREGADMMTGAAAGGVGRPASRTTSAPTSPLKEKRSSFLGKVTSLSQVRTVCRQPLFSDQPLAGEDSV